MIVTKEVEALIKKVSLAHLFHVMGNKGLFMEPQNFSTVQYMNESDHINLLKFKEILLNKISNFDRNAIYLNVGVAGGHLEYANRLMGEKIYISTVEWDKQYKCCSKIREFFDVDVNYLCNDVLEDEFEIIGCKTYYDYAILDRFFPIYQTMSGERIESVLKKFVPYAKKALVVESNKNWSKEQRKYIEEISRRKINITDRWNCFLVDLRKLK